MYTTIDKVDVMAETEDGHLLVQTDHRSADEVAKEPELSVLFALARVLNAHHIAHQKKLAGAKIVYAPLERPPQFLVDALAAGGAWLEDLETSKRTQLRSRKDPAELVDRAFAALSEVVCERLNAEHPEEAIDALEDEHGGQYGDPDEHMQIEYWTTVLELMAVTGEAIRMRVGGSWKITDEAAVPFGFQVKDGSLLLPGNRAQRSLDEGREHGISVLLEALDDPSKLPTRVMRADGPIVPSLRSKAEATSGKYVTRTLFERMPPDAEAPVICYGHDSPQTLAIIRTDSGEPAPDHKEALANLRAQKVEIEQHDIAGMTMLSVGGNFFAAEKLLDVAFMKGLEMRLRDDVLGAIVPRRGVLLVAGIGKNPLNAGVLSRIGAGEYGKEKGRGICPNVIILQHGEPIGMVLPGGSVPVGGEPPPQKRGFFSRLFGRN